MQDVSKYSRDFLKYKTIEDIESNCTGELHELATDIATYWLGNSELIVQPVNNEESFSMFVDKYGNRKVLSL